MFKQKSVEDVLKVASTVIDDLEAAASRASDKANAKNAEVVKLQAEVQDLDLEAKKGRTVAARFKELITVD